MINELVFAGRHLKEFGVVAVDSIDSWDKPQRKVTKIAIPGRSGDLLIDEGAYENVTVPYRCTILNNFKVNYLNLMSYMAAQCGYQRLEFSGDPNVYRMARLQTEVKPEPSPLIRHGSFTLTFDCKPQRWLKEGEKWITLTSDATINNPTSQIAKPIIRIYGTGSVQIGNKTITVNTAGTEYIDFDCDLMDAYESAFNRNSNITVDFTELGLDPGSNGITLHGVTSVDIYPRWFEV